MKSIIVSAPGRICLFGEHMDWCGHHVLASAIDMRTFIEAEPASTGIIEAFSYPPFTTHEEFDIEKEETPVNWNSDLKYVAGVLKAFQKNKTLTYKLQGMKLRFLKAAEVQKKLKHTFKKESLMDLPVSKGLSSSAAMCVAISATIDLIHRFPQAEQDDRKTILEHVSKPETLTFYADMAYTGERKELGINCGQMDQYASAYGGILHINCIKEPAEVRRLKPRTELPLVIGDTKQLKDTPKVLGWLGERFAAKEPEFMEGMKNIVKIVEEAQRELEKQSPNRHRIGDLMNENQYYLKNFLKVSGDCPVSPSRLDALIEAALRAGALGAKLSGSGGGGCIIALCESGNELKVARSINETGGEAYITRVADQGLRIELLEI